MKTVFFIAVLSFIALTTPATAQDQSVVQDQQNNVQVPRGTYSDSNNNGIYDNFEASGSRGPGNGWGRGYGFRGGRGGSWSQAPGNRQGLAQGQGCGLGPAYGRGLGPGRGRGLAPGGKRFVDTDKNGICDLYETTIKKN
ncbi:MAG TPA: hypothetical protein PL123_02295 [Bacteroidales bacterium]|nr:hypothetical protein [Bacteroidales bacterium]